LNSRELIGLETQYLEGTFPVSDEYIFMYNKAGAWSWPIRQVDSCAIILLWRGQR